MHPDRRIPPYASRRLFYAKLYNRVLSFSHPTASKLEDAFNSAWSSIVIPGRWVSFDKQKTKNTARRALLYLMRFDESEPIEHGESGSLGRKKNADGNQKRHNPHDDLVFAGEL